MNAARGWQLPVQHLMPDAVVAFVDGELTPAARDRAAAHLAGCSSCTAETAAQRQARSAIAGAGVPAMPSSLLESLRSIPQYADIDAFAGLGADVAVGRDGTVYTTQRPHRTRFGAGEFLGAAESFGARAYRPWHAGVVVGGLMLGVLAFVLPGQFGDGPDTGSDPVPTGGTNPLGGVEQGVLHARFGAPPRSVSPTAVTASTTTPTTTQPLPTPTG